MVSFKTRSRLTELISMVNNLVNRLLPTKIFVREGVRTWITDQNESRALLLRLKHENTWGSEEIRAKSSRAYYMILLDTDYKIQSIAITKWLTGSTELQTPTSLKPKTRRLRISHMRYLAKKKTGWQGKTKEVPCGYNIRQIIIFSNKHRRNATPTCDFRRIPTVMTRSPRGGSADDDKPFDRQFSFGLRTNDLSVWLSPGWGRGGDRLWLHCCCCCSCSEKCKYNWRIWLFTCSLKTLSQNDICPQIWCRWIWWVMLA